MYTCQVTTVYALTNTLIYVYLNVYYTQAFYMRDNPDGETVDSFDLLVPGIGAFMCSGYLHAI